MADVVINQNTNFGSINIVSREQRWESGVLVQPWTDVPFAEINLNPGGVLPPNRGAIFVATFSAEALASGPAGANGVVTATVFFNDIQSAPVSGNHRFVTTRGNPEWSSHTFIRTKEFRSGVPVDLTAGVRVGGSQGAEAGIQNFVLKIERYDL